MKKFLFMCVAILMILTNVSSGFINVKALTPPQYSPPRFQNVEELVEWIETEDAENFQSGRYRDCLLVARDRGEIFLPVSNDPSVRMTRIQVLHQSIRTTDGNMLISFEFGSPALGQVLASANGINPRFAAIYEAEGIEGFFMTIRDGVVSGNYLVSERIIAFRNSDTGELVERNVPYVINYGIGRDGQLAIIFFIVDGIEFRIQHTHGLADKFINSLMWDRVAINPSATTATPLPPSETDTTNNLPPVTTPNDTVTTPVTPTPPTATIPPNEVAHTRRTVRFAIGNNNYTINGISHTNDVAPFIDVAHGRTMIPLRAVIEAFDAEVEWNPTARTVQIFTDTGVHQLTIDTPLPGGMGVPVIREERVFVPLSYVAGLLGAYPRWDNANLAAYIYQDISH